MSPTGGAMALGRVGATGIVGCKLSGMELPLDLIITSGLGTRTSGLLPEEPVGAGPGA